MTTRLTEMGCLRCKKLMDAASDPRDDDAVPEPGDITICLYCGYLMTFADDLTFRELTDEEISGLDLLAISRIQNARKHIEELKKS